MPSVLMRLDEALLQRIDRAAEAAGASRSETLRALAAWALDRIDAGERVSVTVRRSVEPPARTLVFGADAEAAPAQPAPAAAPTEKKPARRPSAKAVPAATPAAAPAKPAAGPPPPGWQCPNTVGGRCKGRVSAPPAPDANYCPVCRCWSAGP